MTVSVIDPSSAQAVLTLLSDSKVIKIGGFVFTLVKANEAGQFLETAYEFVVPNVEAILEAVNALCQEIATKINHAIAALVSVVDERDPNAEEKRTNYCKMTLKIDDPYALKRECERSLAALWRHQQQWEAIKSDYLYGRVRKTRALAQNVKKLQTQCEELDKKVTSSSSRLLTREDPVEPSVTNVTHTLVQAIPGEPTKMFAVECKPNGEPVLWV